MGGFKQELLVSLVLLPVFQIYCLDMWIRMMKRTKRFMDTSMDASPLSYADNIYF